MRSPPVEPVLFLDIDDTITGRNIQWPYARTRKVLVRGRGNANGTWRVRVSQHLFDELERLDVDVRWLSYWCEGDAVNDFVEQVPGPQFARSTILPMGQGDGWKYRALTESLREEPRPFIWADDTEVPLWGRRVADEFKDIPHLLVAPKLDVGLTREHVAAMRAFLDQHRA